MKREKNHKEKFVQILNKNGFVRDKKLQGRLRDDGIIVHNNDGYDIAYGDGTVIYCLEMSNAIGELALRGEIIVYC